LFSIAAASHCEITGTFACFQFCNYVNDIYTEYSLFRGLHQVKAYMSAHNTLSPKNRHFHHSYLKANKVSKNEGACKVE